jgi:hypothetical protein
VNVPLPEEEILTFGCKDVQIFKEMMHDIKKTTQEGRTLNAIPREELVACCRWLV